jgi:multidrug transporter EmrE-like cation transporter
MDRYFLLEFGSEGIALETAQLDFYASWLGIGLVILSVVGYKLYKKQIKKGRK